MVSAASAVIFLYLLAAVAEANGNEYRDGAHLHFEIMKNGVSEDPAIHLTLEEK